MTLDDLFDQLAPSVARAFREAIEAITDEVVLKQVIEAVERNDVDAAFRAIDFDPSVFNRWYFKLIDVFQQGGVLTVGTFPKSIPTADGTTVTPRFNIRDKRAEDWLQYQSSTLITQIEQDIRNNVRNTMTDGLAAGRNPRNVALDIVGRINPQTGKREGGALGLGAREEEWSRSLRVKLETLDPGYFDNVLRDKRFDGTVQAAIDSGKPLSGPVIDRLMDRYRARALQYRGEMIARTETLAALQRSEWLSIQQAIEKGSLAESDVMKTWQSSGDERVRHSHRELNGVTIPLNEPFVSPDTGHSMMHPGDTSMGATGRDIINCFAPWTKISVSGLRSVIVRKYVGNLVEISTAVGNVLTVTPNHPILTERGWVAACEILKGDKVLYSFSGDGVSFGEADEQHVVPAAHQVYSFHNGSGPFERMGGGTVDFHGEIPDHDVYVITTPCELRDRFQTSASQSIANFSLADTDVSQGVLLFDGVLGERTIDTTENRKTLSGVFTSLLSGYKVGNCCRSTVSFADVGSSDFKVVEARVDNVSSGSKFLGDTVYRETFINEPSDFIDVGRASLLISDFSDLTSNIVKCEADVVKATHDNIAAEAGFLTDTLNSITFTMEKSDDFVEFSSFDDVPSPVAEFIHPHHTGAFYKRPDGVIGNTGDFRDFRHRFTTRVNPNNFFFPVEVTSSTLTHYEGPVFNFETDNGLIVSDGVITHNCRCRVRYKVDWIGQARRLLNGVQ